MNTFLGGDGSPSDKLVINGGSATGNAFLRITNAGGPGVETVANGIPVVQAINGGSTATGAFQLANIVEAGPFDYRLFHGSVDASAPNDWFLRDDFIVPPTGPTTPPITTPTPPITTPTPPITALPPDPPPDPLPPGVYPIIGPRLATYGVVQPIARQIGLTTLGTLHERIGDTLTVGNAGPGAEGWLHSAWGRGIGQQIDNHYQAFADPRASGRADRASVRGRCAARQLRRRAVSTSPGSTSATSTATRTSTGSSPTAAATAYVLQRTGSLNLNSRPIRSAATAGRITVPAAGISTRCYRARATAVMHRRNQHDRADDHAINAGLAFVSPRSRAAIRYRWRSQPRPVLEPQAQIIWQQVHFDGASDGISSVALGSTSGTTDGSGCAASGPFPAPIARCGSPTGASISGARLGRQRRDLALLGSGIAVLLVEQASDAARTGRRADLQAASQSELLHPGRLPVRRRPDQCRPRRRQRRHRPAIHLVSPA